MSLTDLPTLQMNEPLVAAGALLAAVVFVVVVARSVRRWRSTRVELTDPPPLLIPVQRRGSAPPPLYPSRFPNERGVPALPEASASANGGAVAIPEHAVAPAQLAALGRNGHSTANAGSGALDIAAHGVQTATRTNSGSVSKVVHDMPPMDGTLQFLPGRLEVMDGESPGRDIRFVRTWGEVPEISFGRVSGPPYRHVQLRSQTVSRQHARMQYVDGRWKLTNLSQTNPVVINGQPLDTAHGNRVLKDGDQIEMGEVVFRFRER
jgi:hypothetical protein